MSRPFQRPAQHPALSPTAISTLGRIDTTQNAALPGRGGPPSEPSTTVSVRRDWSSSSRAATRYSPQAATNVVAATSAMPARTCGSRIDHNTRSGPAPSSRAASTASVPACWKTARISSTPSASVSVEYGSSSAQVWLSSPSPRWICQTASAETIRVGKISDATSSPTTTTRPPVQERQRVARQGGAGHRQQHRPGRHQHAI